MTNSPKRLAGWIVLLFVSTAGTCDAQVIEKKALTLEGARKVIAAAEVYAKQNNAPGGVIAVVQWIGTVSLRRMLIQRNYLIMAGPTSM